MIRKAFVLSFPLALLMAAVLLLGSCGAKSQDPKEVLTAATQAAREAGSVHAQMNVSLSPLEGESGMALNIQGDAWMDRDAGALEARFTVMGMELSLRYVDEAAYLQFGGKWYTLAGQLMEGVGEGTIDALVGVLSSVPEIISTGTALNELGEKKVGSYECTDYELVPDLQAIAAMDAVRKLAVELDMSVDEIVKYLEDADVTIEVCIQKDEPIIRQVYLAADMELPSLGDLVGIGILPEMARVEITMDFPEYGMEVEVQAPADATPFEGL